MPEKKEGYRCKVMINYRKVFLRTFEREDGRLVGIEMDMHREAETTREAVQAFARAVTLGLECDVPLERYVHKLLLTTGTPSGEVLGSDHIRFVSSVYDYVARELGMRYLGRFELAIHSEAELREQLQLRQALT